MKAAAAAHFHQLIPDVLGVGADASPHDELLEVSCRTDRNCVTTHLHQACVYTFEKHLFFIYFTLIAGLFPVQRRRSDPKL